jgi:transglutaminase-like putative cysteine protease
MARQGPVAAAMLVNAAAQNRWLFVVPVMIGLVAANSLNVRIEHRPERFLIAGVLGAIPGALLALWLPPPLFYLPPVAHGALQGALLGFAAYGLLAQRRFYAWIFGWMLAVISSYVNEASPLVLSTEVALVFVTFASGAAELERLRLWALLGMGVLTAPMAYGLSQLAKASVDPVMGLVLRMTSVAPHIGGAGLQDQLRVGRFGSVPDSDQPVFELSGDLPERLRGVVFDRFDGQTWNTSAALARARLIWPTPESDKSKHTTLLSLADLGERLPMPAGTLRVSGASPTVSGGWVLLANTPRGAQVEFERTSTESLPAEPGLALQDDVALPDALASELRPLAQQIVEGAKEPREQARRIERFFRDNFEYSLETDLGGKSHPLAQLIKDRRPAYCTYFASAMVALLRTLGVPSRLVGGFVPGDVNPYTGRVLVRARDAHAWVEVYLADEGRFVQFDPTPWRSREALMQARHSRWATLEALGSWWRRSWMRVTTSPGEVLIALLRSPITIGLIALAALWQWRGRRRTRQSKARSALDTRDATLRQVHAEYLRSLRKHAQIQPTLSETDDELLARLAKERGDQAANAAAKFVERYRAARFGHRNTSSDEWQRVLLELDQALRSTSTPR